jgi:hypothetical protein
MPWAVGMSVDALDSGHADAELMAATHIQHAAHVNLVPVRSRRFHLIIPYTINFSCIYRPA